jgi:hypothetical protein
VANVIGESDTHHSVNKTAPYGRSAVGWLGLDVDYFDFFDALILLGQASDGLIQGLAELPCQPDSERPGQRPRSQVKDRAGGSELQVADFDHNLACDGGNIQVDDSLAFGLHKADIQFKTKL